MSGEFSRFVILFTIHLHLQYLLALRSICILTSNIRFLKFQNTDLKVYYKLQQLSQCGIGIRIDRKQQNRIQRPEINPNIYGQLIIDKGVKDNKWGKKSLLNKWGWDNWINTCKRMNVNPSLTPHTNIN